jgi:hypothetical protein
MSKNANPVLGGVLGSRPTQCDIGTADPHALSIVDKFPTPAIFAVTLGATPGSEKIVASFQRSGLGGPGDWLHGDADGAGI